MAEYKRQHYVSQFLLKPFSRGRLGLCRYSLATETAERSYAKRTCQSVYFYGKSEVGSKSEKELSSLESRHAAIVQEILRTRTLAFLTPNDLHDYPQIMWPVHQLIILSAIRTKLVKKKIEPTTIDGVRSILRRALARSDAEATPATLERRVRGLTPVDFQAAMNAMRGHASSLGHLPYSPT